MLCTLEPKWKWAVLLGSFMALFIGDGWLCTFGLVYSNLLVTFEESRVATSYVPTVLYGVPMTLSPFVCSAVSRLGCRTLSIFSGIMMFISFVLISFSNSLTCVCVITGLLTSVGLKCLLVSALVAVTFWFDEGSRGLATGIAFTGSGFGSIVFPHLINFLMNEYHWRRTYLIVGATCLHGIISGCLYRPFPQQIVSTTDSESQISSTFKIDSQNLDKFDQNSSFFKTKKSLTELKNFFFSIIFGSFTDTMKLSRKREFIIYCVFQFILYLFLNIPFVYTYDWASEHLALNENQNAWLLSTQGLFLIFGLLSIGCLVDFNSLIRPNFLYGICMVICGISTFLMPYCPDYKILLVCLSFFAFSGSCTFVLPLLCVGEVVGMEWAVAGLGILHLVQGLSLLTGTPVGGWIRDVRGNYDLAFYIAGMVMASVGMVFCIFSLWIKSRDKIIKRNETNISDDS